MHQQRLGEVIRHVDGARYVAHNELTLGNAAKIGTGERQVLEDLGFPQPPTVIHCDNEVAVGLAQKYVKQKLSKSCDMRLHWLQDHVA